MIAWLGMTPHSPQSERKRLAILAGFAFLTGMVTANTVTVATVAFPLILSPFGAPLRSGSRPHAGLCHCRQPEVSETGGDSRERRRAEPPVTVVVSPASS